MPVRNISYYTGYYDHDKTNHITASGSKVQVRPKENNWSLSYDVTNLEATGLQNPDVSRNSVSKLDLDDVTHGQLLGLDGQLFSVPQADGVLRNLNKEYIEYYVYFYLCDQILASNKKLVLAEAF